MGDRTTPMKFGPEWLRNLARERSESRASAGSRGGSATPSALFTSASRSAAPSAVTSNTTTPTTVSVVSSTTNRPATSSASTSNTSSQPNAPKILLAKLRYGREEMLALYDGQTAEAPSPLKSIEQLYQPRGKPPYALNNTFEEDTRENSMRSNTPMGGGNIQGDRYGAGRGRGIILGERARGLSAGDSRGRNRGFARQLPSTSEPFRSSSWHNGAQRGFPPTPDDDPNPSRSWNNGNPMNSSATRTGAEQADWAQKMAFRKTRQNPTNWRQQQNRDEGEEWRSADGVRRGQEKWAEREWPERSNSEKPWTNRRGWGVAGDSEDTLPEWAVENSEACGGTFDSSGAFHGYSNDDSNLPKTQDASYPLARSHTHGSFARSKTAEEGSEEWWASEKAKKLSAKRFDAVEVKFKKSAAPGISEDNANNPSHTPATGSNKTAGQTRDKLNTESVKSRYYSDEEPTRDVNPGLLDEAAALPPKTQSEKTDGNQDRNAYQSNFADSAQSTAQHRIDMFLRTVERDGSTERGNYKSVMMATNNNHLRQKHQNIGTSANEAPKRLTHLFDNPKQPAKPNLESDENTQQKQQENKLVEDILEMNLGNELESAAMTQLLGQTNQSAGMVNTANSMANQMPNTSMQMRMNKLLHSQGMMSQQNANIQSVPLQQSRMMPPIGMTNSMLTASLGLPMGSGSNVVLPLTSMPPPPLPTHMSSGLQGLGGSNIQGMPSGLQPRLQGLQSGMQGLQGNSYHSVNMQGNMQANMQTNMQSGGMSNNPMQSASGMAGFPGGNNSLFMQGAGNSMHNPNDMAPHGQQSNMYPLHGLQQSASQSSFNASMYATMMNPTHSPLPNIPLSEQWYYEDPKKTIQGPFTSKEMYGWYRAGFFSPQLMVHRACETNFRPLATYGMMPFGPMDLLPPQFCQVGGSFDPRAPHPPDNSLMNAQQRLGPDVESLWSQPSADMMWMQQSMAPRDETMRSMYFWDQPTGAMANSLLPEGIAKEMKTEDEILAQMRASQGERPPPFVADALSPEEAFASGTNIAPNLEQLQKLIGGDVHRPAGAAAAGSAHASVAEINQPDAQKPETVPEADAIPEVSANKQVSTGPSKVAEPKPAKPVAKVEEKPAKPKVQEAAVIKTKKKAKDDKKQDVLEPKQKESDTKVTEKQNEEPVTLKKKEEKVNKKELEKEKKEWLKDGFTIVKGAEKKESKKKEKEEARAAEEAERKRKEEEKRAQIEAEKNRQPEPVTRRQQMQEIGQALRQQQAQQVAPAQALQAPVEPAARKAPWSAPSAASDGPALADIQRLEREKKQEQMKEQQLMMQAIAQQHAAHQQREQELQAGQLGWAKKIQGNLPPEQTLTEIQAEARKQASALAVREEAPPAPSPAPAPGPAPAVWGATNGGGFWDSPGPAPLGKPDKMEPRPTDTKPKKKATVVSTQRKDASPTADFDSWCTNMLCNWREINIDVPTFVAFLKDIESPYEVKDYVKCYLGDTKESNDFARQFLERRSRLLRVGTVTPSDDLCSPAVAVNPRTVSGSDYTDLKKTKKTKKNKMLKVDARILGFSVTASEDRINIGDIDTV